LKDICKSLAIHIRLIVVSNTVQTDIYIRLIVGSNTVRTDIYKADRSIKYCTDFLYKKSRYI
jgi:hypothetical protein